MISKITILIIVLLTTGAAFLVLRKNEVTTPKLSGPIVFFGDSITAGVGANPGEDFPTLIGNELGVEIINAGVSGDTTGDALSRIDQDVIAKKPSVVVVELGGNDFLQKVDFEVTWGNFEKIMQRLSETGAKTVIVSVRTSPFSDKYIDLQQDLAKRHDVVYVDNILKNIISDKSLMADEIQPNAAGYQKIAKRLSEALHKLL